jgi:uridylate kinase
MNSDSSLRFRRILLKLSGEALAGALSWGIDVRFLDYLSEEVIKVRNLGVEPALLLPRATPKAQTGARTSTVK